MRQTIVIGGTTFLDIPNLIMLVASVNSGKFTTFRKSTASAGYTPSGAKKFRALAYRAFMGTAGGYLGLGSGDTDVGVDSASGPTNAVTLSNQNLNFFMVGTFETIALREGSMWWECANAKYPYVLSSANNGLIWLFGYEV